MTKDLKQERGLNFEETKGEILMNEINKNKQNNSKNSLIGAKINFKEAKDLADLNAIVQDLKFTIDTLERLELIVGKDNLLMKTLWSSALISYRRCFNSGKRFGLTEKIFKDLKGEPIKAHQYFISQSNKHIAHSVNPFEQIVIDLQLTDPKKEKAIVAISALGMSLVCTNREGIETFKNLAIVAYKYTRKETERYNKIVLDIAHKMPIDNFYKNRRSRIVVPGPNDADISRG